MKKELPLVKRVETIEEKINEISNKNISPQDKIIILENKIDRLERFLSRQLNYY